MKVFGEIEVGTQFVFIGRVQELQDRVAKTNACNYEEMLKISKEIVDFHGEMVLLENYSALNYTGTFHLLIT